MVKKLLRSLREYKKEAILTPICMAMEVFMEIMIPFLLAHLIDDGITGENINVILITGVELVLTAFTSLFFGVQAGKFASVAASGFAKNLREDMYKKVQTYSFHNIDKFSTSSLVTRLTTDVTNVQNAFQMILRIAVRAPLMLVFSLIMALSINVKLSSVLLFVLPVVAFTFFFGMSRVHPLMTSVFKKYDNLNSVVEENVHGIRVVKSFVTEEKEKNK